MNPNQYLVLTVQLDPKQRTHLDLVADARDRDSILIFVRCVS